MLLHMRMHKKEEHVRFTQALRPDRACQGEDANAGRSKHRPECGGGVLRQLGEHVGVLGCTLHHEPTGNCLLPVVVTSTACDVRRVCKFAQRHHYASTRGAMLE